MDELKHNNLAGSLLPFQLMLAFILNSACDAEASCC